MASYGTTEAPAPANKQPLLEKYSSGKIIRSTPPAGDAASTAASAAGDGSEEVKDQSVEDERKAAEQREAAKRKAAAAAASASAPLPTSGVGNFGILVIVTQLAVFICYALAGKSDFVFDDLTQEFDTTQLYNYVVGVNLMMLVGFGYLRAFLKMYGLGAVGFTMFMYCLGVECSILFEPLMGVPGWGSYVNLDLLAFLKADYAVAAILVSFGALIGKVNPTQITILTVLESFFYCFNKQIILVRWIPFVDVGNTIVVHMFGAYFGLAVSAVLGKKTDMSKEASSTTSDVLALIGTLFMWVYWPSFNGGSIESGTAESELAITNTMTALIGSAIMTFALSAMFNGGVISVVDVQSATLAGGVAIGAVCNLKIGPAVALATGLGAGFFSCIGTTYVQSALEKAGLHDTCGVHNLHGLPSVVGGLVSVFIPLAISDSDRGNPGYQLAGMGMTLVVSIFSGLCTGALLKVFKDDAPMAVDSAYFESADEKDVEAA
uniref:Ammonium transporter AmtB-like domain-containing protein n=1 Tax=Florenciella parvula TaxID=236787 RepID=A0A7S2F9Z0_9STRA|mmetsp:Transcript_11213/g.23483  ORF Transcript_11213/g.23483 Transcript_11213/m.23483 type:complete len:492 (+) Transcript_11213:48-1523(+)|eukprot:CAMPEP_0182537906 /NCGR_PEP_ID=MMETSP1323-20130603/22774_1 /TAXON_ID=236787 /ORGANISM="Florenciella parvula, Strain RCC1693" /LENGTH=491 /DNA_ID=CAMNT_0024748335 /DNA_START=40 /DNA_END=1515 /DNA_ORIENTATION=+